VLLLVLTAGGYVASYVAMPLPIRNFPLEVEIPRGAGFRSAIEQLEKAGIPVGRVEFETLARALGRERDIKAGNYQLLQPTSPLELLEKLTRGDVTLAEVRLIEGWTFAQFRDALDNSPNLKHETTGLPDGDVLARVQALEKHPEGLFFPDTYLFSRGSSDLAVLRRSYRAMQRHLAQEWEARSGKVPYATAYEALIMASIIEKETGRAGERDLIGGVLINRLRVGMKLQADPTVIYGLGASFDGNLKKVHLLTDGAYNSYTRVGLPPTPIAMYYVSKGDGSSQFSRTLAEHNRAVARYQLKQTRQK
jgi:UPF0755 protein